MTEQRLKEIEIYCEDGDYGPHGAVLVRELIDEVRVLQKMVEFYEEDLGACHFTD